MTIEEHLKESLPKEYFDLAKVYLVDKDTLYSDTKTTPISCASAALNQGFIWKNTMEGSYFWAIIYDILEDIEAGFTLSVPKFPIIKGSKEYFINLLKVT